MPGKHEIQVCYGKCSPCGNGETENCEPVSSLFLILCPFMTSTFTTMHRRTGENSELMREQEA